MGTPGAREGGGWAGFVPFGRLFFCGGRLYFWAGGSQFDPFLNFGHFLPFFLPKFWHFSTIIENLPNKIKSDENLKNAIITSIK